MALRSKNVVDLVIRNTVEGLEQITKLANDIDELGIEGEQAQQQLLGLTNQLSRLAAQAGAIDAFKRQKDETRQLSQAYEAARAHATELGRAIAQTNTPTKEQSQAFAKAKAEAKQLNEQYKASAVELRRLGQAVTAVDVDLENLGNEQAKLAQQAKFAKAELTGLSTSVQRLNTAKPTPDLTKQLRDGAAKTNQVVSSLPRLLAAIGVTAGLAQVIQAFNQAATTGQTFERALNQITQSADATAAQIARLQEVSDKYGIEVTGLERAFLNFNAAIEGTNFEGEKGNRIFEAFAGALGTLGKSSADTERALVAVNQIISKGTVSTEELRQQLGEHLPGAFRLAAESIGVTEKQLAKLLETGQVAADDLLPKMGDRIIDAFSLDKIERVEGLAAAQNRFATATTNLFRAFAESGVADVLEGIINTGTAVLDFFSGASVEASRFAVTTDDVTEAAKSLSPELQKIAEDMQLVGLETSKSSAELAELQRATDELAKLRNVDNLKRQFADLQTSITNAETQLKQLYEGISNPAAFGVRDDGIRALQQSIVLLEASINKMRAEAAVLSAEIESTLNPALDNLGDGADAAAEQTQKLINALGKQTEAAQQALSAAELELDVLEAQGSARIAQINALLRIAQAKGDEVEATRQAVRLAEAEADIAKEQAKQKQKVAFYALVAAQSLREQAEADGDVSTAERQSIAEAEALAKQKQALANAAQAAADALRAEANAQSGIKGFADQLERERKEREKSVDATRQQTKATQESAEAEKERSSRIKLASDHLQEMAARADTAKQALADAGQSGSDDFQQLNAELELLKANLEIVNDFGRSPRDFSANFDYGFGELIRNAERAKTLLGDMDTLMQKFGEDTASAGELSQALARANALARNEAQLLGEERLRTLRDAIADAQNRMQALGDQANETRDRIAELDAELAEAQGNDARAKQLRLELEFAEKLAEVEARIAEARLVNDRENIALLEEERRKLEQLLELRQKAITEDTTRKPSSTPTPAPATGSGNARPIAITVNSTIFDQRTLQDVTRQIGKELKRIGALTA